MVFVWVFLTDTSVLSDSMLNQFIVFWIQCWIALSRMTVLMKEPLMNKLGHSPMSGCFELLQHQSNSGPMNSMFGGIMIPFKFMKQAVKKGCWVAASCNVCCRCWIIHCFLRHKCGYPANMKGFAQIGDSVEMQEAHASQSIFNFSGNINLWLVLSFYWPLMWWKIAWIEGIIYSWAWISA